MDIIINNENATCQNCQIGKRVSGNDAPRTVDIIFAPDTDGKFSYNTQAGYLKQSEVNCLTPCPLNVIVRV